MKEHSGNESLVALYERLLVHRHRFVLAGVTDAIAVTLRILQRMETLLVASARGRDKQKNPSFHEVLDRITTRLNDLVTHFPVFLGDTELSQLQRSLREFVRHDDLESFWDLTMAAEEKSIADQLTTIATQDLEAALVALETTIAKTLPVASSMRMRRDQFVRLMEDCKRVTLESKTKRMTNAERARARVLAQLREALADPALEEERQLDADNAALNESIIALLATHMEACRAITTANATVTPQALFTESEQGSIAAFIKTCISVDKQINISDQAELDTFLHQLELFERAAIRDAFRVCSSVLKLDFLEPLDRELFVAYASDVMQLQDERRALVESDAFVAATRRVDDAKEAVRLEATRRYPDVPANDDHCSIQGLVATQIADAFTELGVDGRAILSREWFAVEPTHP